MTVLEGELRSLAKRADELSQMQTALKMREQAALADVMRSNEALAQSEKHLEKLGTRPMRAKLTLREMLSNRAQIYEDAYTDLIRPWVVAEQTVANLRNEVAGFSAEHLRVKAGAAREIEKIQEKLRGTLLEHKNARVNIELLRQQL